MDLRRLITRSFIHYLRGNLMASVGIAIATAVITGALIIGDSLSHSLETAVRMRLGNITHSVTAGERLFTKELANRFEKTSGVAVSAGLVAEGMAVAEGGTRRLNRIQVLGIDKNFGALIGTDFDFQAAGPGQVIISENMARRLQLAAGDFFMLHIKRAGVIPMNTPLVSDAGQIVSRRVQVVAIAGNEDYGRFNLRMSQSAPYNVFVDISWLNMVMELEEMANIIFIADPDTERGILESHLKDSFHPEDANLKLRELPGTAMTEVNSGRVFINEHVSSRLADLFPGSMQFLTYFVNSVEKGERSSPYCFIAADSRKNLNHGEIMINRWLADDIEAGPGDSLTVRYWETGTRRELVEREIRLMVTGIVEMEEATADSVLMPFLPGLSDAGNCRDWDAGVPVVLDRIRDKDEDYWDAYRGTPRAYISLEQGFQLWTNRFGNITSLWLPDEIGGPEEASRSIAKAISPLTLGFMVNELREQGLRSAAQGVDFSMLFLGLGFFVMLAGLMLFFLLMLFNIEKRGDQIRLFSSLGYSRKLIRKIYLGEGMAVALVGSVAGLFLAITYAWGVHYALSEIWQDIVRTDLLVMTVNSSALFSGFAIGLIIASGVIVFGTSRFLIRAGRQGMIMAQPGKKESIDTAGKQKESIMDPENRHVSMTPGNKGDNMETPDSYDDIGNKQDSIMPGENMQHPVAAHGNAVSYGPHPDYLKESSTGDKVARFLFSPATAAFPAVAALLMLLWQLRSGMYANPAIFVVSGGLLLISLMLAARLLLSRLERTGFSRIDLTRLGMKNLTRNPVRSLSVIILLALGTFIIVAAGSHRKDAVRDENLPGSGTGGFDLIAEATVPVLYNLNTNETRIDLNIPPRLNFIQFMASYADDASCLNLNEVQNPRILSVDPSLLQGRFSFATSTRWLDRDNPWESLNVEIAGVVPAIADQAVIQWGMGKKVGDTLIYTDEMGRDLRLLLVGGLANSVFQGNVIISEENFMKHFPTTSGSSFFIIGNESEASEEVKQELEFIFRDHGWEMETTSARLNEFNSVENTYLAIFLMLGALGVLIGVGGLAVVMARSIMERKSEIALFTALGYRRYQIFLIIFREYLVLLVGGLAAGLVPALIASIPSLMPGGGSMGSLAVIMLVILLNGIFWILLIANLMIKKTGIAAILRND